MSNSSKKLCSSEDVEKRNSKSTRKEEIQKNEEETSQYFQTMKLPMNLRNWPIFYLLKPEFIPKISSVMVYGSLGNRAIIETTDKNVYNLSCTEDDHSTGDIQTTLCPKKIEELCGKNIKTFACSDSFILALTEGGEVYFWEFKKYIATRKSPVASTPIRVLFFDEKRITNIACGSNHSLALTSDGRVYAWGQNNYGQIGTECCTTFYSVPRQIKRELKEKKVICISCGSTFNIVMTNENKLYGWGNNENCQISIDTQSAPKFSFDSTSNNVPSQKSVVYFPREITTISNKIVELACGYHHTLALSIKGEIYAWGDNRYGQLGVNNEMKSSVPIMVKLPKMVKMLHIAAYGNLSVAEGYDKYIYVWGKYLNQCFIIPFRTMFSTIHEPFAYNSCRIMHKPLTVCTNIYDEEKSNILKSLETAFDDSSTSDFTIIVDKQPIYVHKSILKIRCQHFKNKFQHNWIENDQTTSESSSVYNVLDKFSYIVYKTFLKYLYTGTVPNPPDISLQNIFELIELAILYRETKLIRDCKQKIIRFITVPNIAFFYGEAFKNNVKEFEEFCLRIAFQHFKAVVESETFAKLDANTMLNFIRKAANVMDYKGNDCSEKRPIELTSN